MTEIWIKKHKTDIHIYEQFGVCMYSLYPYCEDLQKKQEFGRK